MRQFWFYAPPIFGLVMVTLVCGAALIWGRPLERRAAAWIWSAWVMVPLLQRLTGSLDPALLFAIVDFGVLTGLAALVWRSGRNWPVVAVAAQATALALDLLRLLQPMQAYVYMTALAITAYVLLGALASGVLSSWRQRRRRDGLGLPS